MSAGHFVLISGCGTCSDEYRRVSEEPCDCERVCVLLKKKHFRMIGQLCPHRQLQIMWETGLSCKCATPALSHVVSLGG